MKKKFISIIFILLILLNIINCYNLVYATDIQSEDYELELDYNVEGPLWYVLTVNGLECLNANGDGGFYYLSLLKNNQDGSRTIIEETINTDNLKMKSENEKILKPYIEDGHVLVKGISEGITKLRLIYNYNGKECIKETYWTVRPNPTPYFQVKHSSGLFNIRMAVLLDNSNIEMSNKEQKNVGSVLMEVKEDTRSSKGATFIIKNTTDEEYAYGPTYIIEKFENQAWKEIDTLTGEPLTWNSIVYSLKAHEEKEFIIDWSLGYGELKSGTYRLVKSDLRKANSPESRSYSVYAEFDIK